MAFGFLKGLADKAGFGEQLEKLAKDKNFMEGAMAAAAWVAAADGSVGEREKAKVGGFIQRSDMLKHFDRMACIRQFNTFVDEFEFAYGMGVDRCTKELSEVKDANKCLNIARLGVAIAASEADENDNDPISTKERQVLQQICQVLRVDFKSLGI